MKMKYFEQENILHLAITEEPEAGSVEVSPNITAELNTKGELIGIEILNASNFIRDTIVELSQKNKNRLAADERDREIIDCHCDALNAEAEDVLRYQRPPLH